MLGAILGLPEQVDNAKRIALGVSFEPLRQTFSSLVIAGFGGSAIGGDFLRAGYESTLTLPVTVVRDYHLPGYVERGHAGVRHQQFRQHRRDAGVLRRSAAGEGRHRRVLDGWRAGARAKADAVPLVTFPGGLQPRAALGYSFIPLVVAAARLGFVPEVLLDEIDEAIAVLREVRNACNPDVPGADERSQDAASRGWASSRSSTARRRARRRRLSLEDADQRERQSVCGVERLPRAQPQ